MTHKLIMRNTADLPAKDATAVAAPTAAGAPKALKRSVTSEVLFAGARELMIKHASEHYCLRITSQGKLILTK